MHPPDSSWQQVATGGLSRARQAPSPWWQQTLTLLRSPLATAILAVAMVLGLLLAFGQVVAQAVAQADQQRSARDARDAAVWRCKQLRSGSERGNCLAQLNQDQALASPAP